MRKVMLCALLLSSGCAFSRQNIVEVDRRQDVTLCFRKVNCVGLTHDECLFELQGCSEVFR